MNIQELASLVALREFLYVQVNGLTGLKKERVRPVQALISKLDNLIVEEALAADFNSLGGLTTQRAVVSRETTLDDFKRSIEMVEKAVLTTKVEVDDKGCVTIVAPGEVSISEDQKLNIKPDASDLAEPVKEEPVKQVRAKPAKKRAAFRRADAETDPDNSTEE